MLQNLRESELGGTQVCIKLKFDSSRTSVKVDRFRGLFWRYYFLGCLTNAAPVSTPCWTNIELESNLSEGVFENANLPR